MRKLTEREFLEARTEFFNLKKELTYNCKIKYDDYGNEIGFDVSDNTEEENVIFLEKYRKYVSLLKYEQEFKCSYNKNITEEERELLYPNFSEIALKNIINRPIEIVEYKNNYEIDKPFSLDKDGENIIYEMFDVNSEDIISTNNSGKNFNRRY